jgi:hypothetical protein
MIQALVTAHIAVLGYWLGAELVINSDFRYACFRSSLPPGERNALMQHVLDVDQHVRYALVLQFSLGFALAFLLGYLPGGDFVAITVLAVGVAWIAWVEWVHRARATVRGPVLARLDRGIRYAVILGLCAWCLVQLIGGDTRTPTWLVGKVFCFAAVLGCGVGIRLALRDMRPAWQELLNVGSSDELEQRIRGFYRRGTRILMLLWMFIALIVLLSLFKPT